MRRLLATLLVVLVGSAFMACEDDSVFRSGDPPPVVDAGPEAGGGTGGAGGVADGTGGAPPTDPDGGTS